MRDTVPVYSGSHCRVGGFMSRIGIELDGVVCNMLSAAGRAFGEPSQPNAFSLGEMYPMISDQHIHWWVNSPMTYRDIDIVDGCYATLSAWNTQHQLFFVTNRPPHTARVTEQWLTRQQLGFAPVYFTTIKDIEVGALMLDIFIESDARQAAKLAKLCRTYILDLPYNHWGAEAAIRARDWGHLSELINDANQ